MLCSVPFEDGGLVQAHVLQACGLGMTDKSVVNVLLWSMCAAMVVLARSTVQTKAYTVLTDGMTLWRRHAVQVQPGLGAVIDSSTQVMESVNVHQEVTTIPSYTHFEVDNGETLPLVPTLRITVVQHSAYSQTQYHIPSWLAF